nr:MAG TPA: hypothetical protein [Caudoviricetes sp.]
MRRLVISDIAIQEVTHLMGSFFFFTIHSNNYVSNLTS